MEELRLLDLLATPQQPRPRDMEHADLGKLTYLSCAIKVGFSSIISACLRGIERSARPHHAASNLSKTWHLAVLICLPLLE